MRSRPKLSLYLSPSRPTPGAQLVAEAVLESRSETPIDGVVFELEGIESRFTHASHAGDGASTMHYDRHKHVSLVAKTPAATLAAGEHRVRTLFQLPDDLPPSFKGPAGSIEYSLRVRVDIPWWPDRRERFVVPVRLPAPAERKAVPARFATSPNGPRGKELYIEASVDSARIELGGSIDGAVSLQNVEFARVRRVEVAFCAIDHALVESSAPRRETGRWSLVVHEGAPPEGAAIRFSSGLPADAPPSFRGRVLELLWQIEVRAVIAFGKDVILHGPLEMVMAAAAGPARRPKAPRVPPIGHERRALLWAQVAEKTKTIHDREEERLTLEVDAAGPGGGPGVGVSLAIALEHRGEDGLHYVATIDWADLGLEVQVAERRWVDAFRREIDLEDGAFGKRAIVRGREAAQVVALLEPRVREVLLGFDRIALDDEGCELASAGGAESVSELEAFVWRAIEAAHRLAGALARLPPPASMAAHVDAWRTFARESSGRLAVGDMRVDDATWGGHALRVATRWSEHGAPEATCVHLALAAPLDAEIDSEAAARRLSAGTRARLERLRGDLRVLRLGPAALEAELAGSAPDPRAAEPALAVLLEVARELAGSGQQGPYR